MAFLPNLNFLRYFYSAGKHESISRAAEENFVSQSAISQGIQKLEKELGKQLITHQKNLFQLTSEGKILLGECEGIFSIFSNIDDLFSEQEGVYKGKLIIMSSYSFAITALPVYLKQLLKLHPDVQPILRMGHTGLIRDFVNQGIVDLGIILVSEDSPGFDSQEIFHGEHRLYQAKGESKTKMDRLIISEDKREDNILLDYIRESGQPLPPIIQALSWQVIAGLIKQKLGIGLLPDYVAKAHDLALFPYDLPKIPYRILAIKSKNNTFSRNAQMFIELMKSKAIDKLD